jgi:hypothetical protein
MSTVTTTASVTDINKITGLSAKTVTVNDLEKITGMSAKTVTINDLEKIAGLQSTASEVDSTVDNAYPHLINNKHIPGRYLTTQMHANAGQTATPTNTQIVFTPIWVSKKVSISALMFKTSATANAGETAIMGIYAESESGMIGARIAKSDVVTLLGTTYTAYDCAIPVTEIPAGKYWLALSRSGVTATIYGCTASLAPFLWASMSFTATNMFTSKNAFPAYAYAYDGDLPTDLSSVDVQVTMGAVAIAPSLCLKLA